MASGDFPFGVLGLVHVAQRDRAAAPAARRRAARPARLGREPRRATRAAGPSTSSPRARVDGEPVWRDRSTYLHRERRRVRQRARRHIARSRPSRTRSGRCPATSGAATPRSPATATRSTCTGSPRALFGQPGAIAHGMWTKARCLAALQGHLPDAFAVEVAFKLPVRLPARVAFASWREARSGASRCTTRAAASRTSTARSGLRFRCVSCSSRPAGGRVLDQRREPPLARLGLLRAHDPPERGLAVGRRRAT